MPKPLFRTKANRIKSPAEHKAQAERTKVVKTIRRICEQKAQEGKFPPRATWRELRDVLTEDEFKMLNHLIKWDVVTVYPGVNFDTYETDEAKLIAFERDLEKFDC